MASEERPIHVVNAIAAVRDLAISPVEAAAKVVSSCEDMMRTATLESISTPGDTPGLGVFLWAFWAELTDVASLDSSEHNLDRVVSVLRELKKRGRKGCDGWRLWGEDMDWEKLPIFGPSVREDYYLHASSGEQSLDLRTPEAHAVLISDAQPDPHDLNAVAYANARDKWIGLHQFLMRLWKENIAHFDVYGLWAMREGLEDLDLNKPESFDVAVPRELAIQAAAACIEEAADTMYACREIMGPNGRDDWPENHGAPGLGGKRWKGVDGYHPDRWVLWKEVFGEVVAGEGKYKMPDHVVAASQRAIRAMELTESSKS